MEEKYLKSLLPIIKPFFSYKGKFHTSAKLHITYHSLKSEPRCFRLHWWVSCDIMVVCSKPRLLWIYSVQDGTQQGSSNTLDLLYISFSILTWSAHVQKCELSTVSKRHWPPNSKQLQEALRGEATAKGSCFPCALCLSSLTPTSGFISRSILTSLIFYLPPWFPMWYLLWN